MEDEVIKTPIIDGKEVVLEVDNIDITFGSGKNLFKAVSGASFNIYKGETFSLVGESGSGKTTSIRNLDPTKTFIISTTGKRPGIKGAARKYPNFMIADGKITGNFYASASVDQIGKVLQVIDKKMPDITTVVIDD